MRALRDVLDNDTDCGDVLQLVDGCNGFDCEIYQTLVERNERLSIDEITDAVDRDRSATYRAVSRLHDFGYLDREQETYDSGGYCYRYKAVAPETVGVALKAKITECHADFEGLIDDFVNTYGSQHDR